jgi:hypothetical protein
MQAALSNPKNNPKDGFVTRTECALVSAEIKRDLDTIKIALIGSDMQGGLVNKVNDLSNKVVDLSLSVKDRQNTEKQERVDDQQERRAEKTAKKAAWSNEKVALIGVTGGLLGIVLGHFLNLLFVLIW